jgi:hypothetical protein
MGLTQQDGGNPPVWLCRQGQFRRSSIGRITGMNSESLGSDFLALGKIDHQCAAIADGDDLAPPRSFWRLAKQTRPGEMVMMILFLATSSHRLLMPRACLFAISPSFFPRLLIL